MTTQNRTDPPPPRQDELAPAPANELVAVLWDIANDSLNGFRRNLSRAN
jgi:hypothetical protein